MAKYALLIPVLACIMAIANVGHSETPCTYDSHNDLQIAAACVTAYQASAGLDVPHRQLVNSLQNTVPIPPQPYPRTDAASFISNMIVAEGLIYGFRGHFAYPPWYFMYPFLGY